MNTVTDKAKCPICGHEIQGRDHSRMGERATPEGPVEYWACFQEKDVFSCKHFTDEEE